MSSSTKKLQMALVLVVVLVSALAQLSNVYAAESSTRGKTLSFLNEVVKLDTAKYHTTFTRTEIEYPANLGGLPREWMYLTFERAGENKIEVTCAFIDGNLTYCRVSAIKGSLLYTQTPSANVLNAAKNLLERYQAYAGVSCQSMIDMLNIDDISENITKTSGNTKLEVSNKDGSTLLSWKYTANSLDFPLKQTSLRFRNGSLWFMNDWNLYNIGNININTSKEEAIEIARKAVRSIPTLHVKLGDGSVTDVQCNLADEPVKAELNSGPREPLTLFPLWHVQFYFDEVHYGYYGVAVDIWADTKQVYRINPTGLLADPTSLLRRPENGITSVPTINIVATIVIIAIIVIAKVTIKKRRK